QRQRRKKLRGGSVVVWVIEPMLLQRSGVLPEAAEWLYELKLDGYRALAINSAGRVQFRSRNDNDFSVRYPAIVSSVSKTDCRKITMNGLNASTRTSEVRRPQGSYNPALERPL